MSNVRPGDRAIVVRCAQPENLHKIVLVLHEAVPEKGIMSFDGRRYVPVVRYPNGDLERYSGPRAWFVESLGSPFVSRRLDGSDARVEMIGMFADDCLRSIRDTDAPDEMIQITGPAPEHGRPREIET